MIARACMPGGHYVDQANDEVAVNRVRVDAVASVAVEAGVLGAALAAGIVDVLTAGGRRYENGRLMTSRLGADLQELHLHTDLRGADARHPAAAGPPRDVGPDGPPVARRPG